jgi:[acyl-carrier-protein] S-malonyltransferase
MAPVVAEFAAVLERTEFQPDRAPVYWCASGRPFDDVRAELAKSLTAPVRWTSLIRHLFDQGARRFVEFGGKGVLRGLIARTLPPESVAVERAAPRLAVSR